MEITSQTPAVTGGPSAAVNPPSSTVINSDFETFIRMLTVQMENQDPLNPLESSEFATQLATFSSVEQQVLTNDLLTNLGNQLGSLGASQLSGWLGMEGRAHVPVNLAGEPVTLTTQGDPLGETHQLVVRDANGNDVARFDTDAERQTVTWGGLDANGTPLPNGTYQVVVESFAQDELITTTPVEVHGRITEARLENGQTRLVFDGGQDVPVSEILGLREPDAQSV